MPLHAGGLNKRPTFMDFLSCEESWARQRYQGALSVKSKVALFVKFNARFPDLCFLPSWLFPSSLAPNSLCMAFMGNHYFLGPVIKFKNLISCRTPHPPRIGCKGLLYFQLGWLQHCVSKRLHIFSHCRKATLHTTEPAEREELSMDRLGNFSDLKQQEVARVGLVL